MGVKIYRKNNYCVIDDGSKKEFFAGDEMSISLFDGGDWVIWNTAKQSESFSFKYTMVEDENGTPVGDASAVEEYLTLNTNFKTASGGSGAELMKSGQTVSYRTGDDGDLESGRVTDFFTLSSDNTFGTTDRFTDELGGQTYANDIVIDWSTYNGTDVLGYSRVIQSATWNVAIDDSLASSLGSYTSGWRLSNIKEIVNIANYGTPDTLDYSPFHFPSTSIAFYSSTSAPSLVANAMSLKNLGGEVMDFSKVAARSYMPVRNFTVNGTTLT